MTNQKLLTTLFIFFTLTTVSHCISEESFDKFLNEYTKFSSQLYTPMNSFSTDALTILATSDSIYHYIDNFSHFVKSDAYSFTFAADYEMREESKSSGTVPVHVRILFDNPIPVKNMRYSLRYKHALDMTSITCNPMLDMKKNRYFTYDFSQIDNPNNSDVIGLYTSHGIPFRRFMQKFYEQTHQNLVLDETEYFVTIQIMEAYEGLLTIPLNNIIENPSTEQKFNLLMNILETGDNLYGNRKMHGDIQLSNFGYNIYQDTKGNPLIRPVLIFSDYLLDLSNNFKSNTFYEDGIQRDSAYTLPWNNVRQNSDENAVFTYTPDNKEESWAYLGLMADFAVLNGLDKSIIFKKFSKTLREDYNLTSSLPQDIPSLEMIFATAQRFYTEFTRANKKIFI